MLGYGEIDSQDGFDVNQRMLVAAIRNMFNNRLAGIELFRLAAFRGSMGFLKDYQSK